AHMGFVTLGFFIIFSIFQRAETAGAVMGIEGGMVQMISHGFISGALFLCVGVLYDRMHTREISAYGGVINRMPWFGAFVVFFAMANAGLPGTSGFVGELMVILAAFQADFWFAFLAATTLVLAAAFTLWLVKRVIFGEVGNEQVAKLEDLNRRETLNLGVLAAATLAIGLWPKPLIEVMEPTIAQLVQQVQVSKLPSAIAIDDAPIAGLQP
ncbi:MAG: proton-conducting transporter membrane subunit, partial [Lamprobacter sp.]|uniref:complex I subunit 4 family protein n=1 Tax=Lamprobacter sp. TaxID=3100796 RepID=UPI002B2604C3